MPRRWVPTCALYSRDDGCCEELLLLLEVPTAVPRLEGGSACCCDGKAWLCLPLIFRRMSLLLFFSPDGTLRGSSVGLCSEHTQQDRKSGHTIESNKTRVATHPVKEELGSIIKPRALQGDVMVKDCRGLLQLPRLV
jgi:hypothetical protein